MSAESQKTAADVYGGVDPASPPVAFRRSAAFQAYMAEGWADVDRSPRLVPGAPDAARAHRERLSDALPGHWIVSVAGRQGEQAEEAGLPFQADADFLWLVGAGIEGAVLVLSPAAAGHDARLFVEPPARPGDVAFFGDANRGELWVGPAAGPEDWRRALGLDVRPIDELPAALRGARGALRVGPADPRLPAELGGEPSVGLVRALDSLRIVKDAWEVAQLREAVRLTEGGIGEIARALPEGIAGGGERYLQGTFDRFARTHGRGTSFGTIVGAGADAAILHWSRCDGPVRESDLVLCDTGVETHSHYAGDVTRTLPASGTFSQAGRAVYELVERAHRAALAEVRAGAPWTAFHHAAMAVIARGLEDWGVLPVSAQEALAPGGQQHRRWIVCGIGHPLGLTVHDWHDQLGQAYMRATIEPGMVLTVEPGLYFHRHDLRVPPELRGIGARIEQDVLVGADGIEVLDDRVPIDSAGVERWVAAQQLR